MQHTNRLVIKGWTWPLKPLHRSPMNVKRCIQVSHVSKVSLEQRVGVELPIWQSLVSLAVLDHLPRQV